MNDDLISRAAAIDVLSVGKELLSRVLDDIDVVGADREKYSWGLGLIESYIKDIEELPPAQPEEASVILGTSKDGVRLWYKCSVCGEPANADDNYCCNCGRKFINGCFDR